MGLHWKVEKVVERVERKVKVNAEIEKVCSMCSPTVLDKWDKCHVSLCTVIAPSPSLPSPRSVQKRLAAHSLL